MSDASKQICLQLWTEIDNNLPEHGTNPSSADMEGNWSCWNGGKHIFGSKGMDCWEIVEYVADKVQPKNILEIGFNAGHSACMWLSRTNANITSVDIKYSTCHRLGATFLKNKFPNRFKFIQCDSTQVYEQIKHNSYDLIIVDGGHGTEVCISDCNLSLKLNAEYLLVDDAIVAETVKNGIDVFVETNKEIVRQIHTWNAAWGVVLYKISSEPNTQLNTDNFNAQYGIDDCFIDVSEKMLFHFARNGKINLWKSYRLHHYFGDPCFGKLKVLKLKINGTETIIDENRDMDLFFDLI